MSKQDDLENGRFLFCGPNDFHKEYPTIATLRVTVQIFFGGDNLPPDEIRHFTKESPPDRFIRCPRRSCRKGDWDISKVLHEMVKTKETSRTVLGVCPGQQYVNRQPYRKCLTLFKTDIEMTYKNA